MAAPSRDRTSKSHSRIFVVSGLSGSGKSTAIHALEDCGYFCVDNLPVSLLGKFLELCEASGVDRLAAVIDVRGREFLGGYRTIFTEIVEAGKELKVIFLEASDEVLLRRFKETRRRHPLAEPGRSIEEALAEERSALAGLRDIADIVVDTSDLNIHQLKKVIQGYVTPDTATGGMVVSLTSFGFKYGLPKEADIVLDVRFLPNPYFVPELRHLPGTAPPVAAFVLSHAEAREFLDRLVALLQFLIPLYEVEGKPYLTVALGCTGGLHRSVALVEEVARRLTLSGRNVTVRHRDVEQGR